MTPASANSPASQLQVRQPTMSGTMGKSQRMAMMARSVHDQPRSQPKVNQVRCRIGADMETYPTGNRSAGRAQADSEKGSSSRSAQVFAPEERRNVATGQTRGKGDSW